MRDYGKEEVGSVRQRKEKKRKGKKKMIWKEGRR